MYIPKHFAQPDREALCEIIRTYPLATLVTHTSDGFAANHLPMHLTADEHSAGILSGHVAKANPLWTELHAAKEVLDAPASFIEKLAHAIVGIELEITSLTGKWKASQNQSVENQLGAVQGLQDSDTTERHQMASIMTTVKQSG